MVNAVQENNTYSTVLDAITDQVGNTADLRRQALTHFSEFGLPTTRVEDWRFTNISDLTATTFEPAPAADVSLAEYPQATVANLTTHRLVFVNGRWDEGLSDIGTLPDGVRFCALSRAIANNEPDVDALYGTIADWKNDGFVALNTALATDGVFLAIADGVKHSTPFEVIYLTTATDPDTATWPRQLVTVGNDCSVHWIENHAGGAGHRYLTNTVTEITVGDRSYLEHTKMQHDGAKAWHISFAQARVGTDSDLKNNAFNLGADGVRNEYKVWLGGEESNTTLNGLYIGNGTQHRANYTKIDHAVPNCTSWEVYKGILDDESHGVFNGKIFVHEDAQKTDAKQNNSALILNDGAKINTKPELEIYADDVKCTHGCTVGALSDEGLFYMQARGIDEATARHLLIYAYASEVISEVGVDEVRAQLEDELFATFV
jgi:Fe-S cluster assembly protein SufD